MFIFEKGILPHLKVISKLMCLLHIENYTHTPPMAKENKDHILFINLPPTSKILSQNNILPLGEFQNSTKIM